MTAVCVCREHWGPGLSQVENQYVKCSVMFQLHWSVITSVVVIEFTAVRLNDLRVLYCGLVLGVKFSLELV